MLNQTQVWIRAARLRTLPLSVSGIIVGNALCLSDLNFSWILFVLLLLTAISFQIISNLANDYGDGVKGTDNEQRVGPERVLQAGLLSREALKKGIVVSATVSLVLALGAIFYAFGTTSWMYILIFLGLSVLSVWAAITYTVGEGAYGYRGWGDFFVLLFFGGLSVMGSYFVQLKTINSMSVLLALVVGLLSVGVLNLNNMRDHVNDAAVGKRTVAVLLGDKAKAYHLFLIGGALAVLFGVFFYTQFRFYWLPLLVAFPLMIHLRVVLKNKISKDLDPELKKLAGTTFLLSLLIFITLYLG